MRKCINIILICSLLSNFLLCANANNVYFCFKQDKETIYQDDEFVLSFDVSSAQEIKIGTFGLKINFDSSVIDFKKLELNGIEDNEIKYICNDGELDIIYLRSNSGIFVGSSKETRLFNIKFKTKENANLGTTKIKANFDGLGDIYANPIDCAFQDGLSINVNPPKQHDCTLKYLETSEGELTPEFSPGVTNYSLDVPYEVDRIDISAEPNDVTSIVKINRKTLQKAGSSTIIKVTVTSQDKESKLVYQITVNRHLKEDNKIFNSSSKSANKKSSKSKSSDNEESLEPDDELESTMVDAVDNPKADSSNKSIQVKDNDFIPFLTGVLLSVVVALGGFAVYKYYKHKKNKENKEDNGKTNNK